MSHLPNERVVLYPDEKECVEKWLKSDERGITCPFDTLPDYNGLACSAALIVCTTWFPRLKGTIDCPCKLYAFETVVRRARAMLREK